MWRGEITVKKNIPHPWKTSIRAAVAHVYTPSLVFFSSSYRIDYRITHPAFATQASNQKIEPSQSRYQLLLLFFFFCLVLTTCRLETRLWQTRWLVFHCASSLTVTMDSLSDPDLWQKKEHHENNLTPEAWSSASLYSHAQDFADIYVFVKTCWIKPSIVRLCATAVVSSLFVFVFFLPQALLVSGCFYMLWSSLISNVTQQTGHSLAQLCSNQ